MAYYLYKISWTSRHFYIGQHSANIRLGLTPEQDTSYWGSPLGGVKQKFTELIEQYGLPTKQILLTTDCLTELRELEHLSIKQSWEEFGYFCINKHDGKSGFNIAGKTHSAEHRAKLYEAKRGNTKTKGKVWVNNGIENKMVCIPEGYVRGRLNAK